MVLVLSEADVERQLELAPLVDVVAETLVRQAAGEVERPERPHFPVGVGLDGDEPTGTGIAMPAYVHGTDHYATKLVGVHEGNTERGLPTINAQIVLTDARTGVPEALVAGTTVTNARTGCIGAAAVRALAPVTDPLTLGVVGAGAQARWQTRAIATVASLVTATTATEPVFPAAALAPGALVVAVGAFTDEMQELEPAVLADAERVFADVPSEVAHTGDLLASSLEVSDLVELGVPLDEGYTRESPSGRLVVASVGSATLDATAGAAVYRRAVEAGDGTEVSL